MAFPHASDEGTYTANASNSVGTTGDQYMNIQTLITAVEATGSGGVIVFPAGSYELSQGLVVSGSAANSSISIVGAGWSCEGGGGGTSFQPLFAAGDVFTVDQAAGGGIQFRNFYIDRGRQIKQGIYLTTTAASASGIPSAVGGTFSVEVTPSVGITIGSFILIKDGSGNTVYGYVLSIGSGTPSLWNILVTAPGSTTLASGATITLQNAISGASFNLKAASTVLIDGVSTDADYITLSIGTPGGVLCSNISLLNGTFQNIAASLLTTLGSASRVVIRNCSPTGAYTASYFQQTTYAAVVNSTAFDLSLSANGDQLQNIAIDAVDCESFACGVRYSSKHGSLTGLSLNGVTVDGATTFGAIVLETLTNTGDPAEQSQISDVKVSSCWITSNDGVDVPCITLDAQENVAALTGISISNSRIEGANFASPSNLSAAITIINGCSNVTVMGCELFISSPAVNIGGKGSTQHVVVAGNNLGSLNGTVDPNGFGVTISPATDGALVSDVVIVGNQFAGNASGAISVQGSSSTLCSDIVIVGNSMGGFSSVPVMLTGTIGNATAATGLVNVQALSNPGYNPVGPLSGAPVIPASGIAQINPYPFPVRIIADFPSGISMSIVPASGGSATVMILGIPRIFTLGVGESVVLEYGGMSETWTWIGL